MHQHLKTKLTLVWNVLKIFFAQFVAISDILIKKKKSTVKSAAQKVKHTITALNTPPPKKRKKVGDKL